MLNENRFLGTFWRHSKRLTGFKTEQQDISKIQYSSKNKRDYDVHLPIFMAIDKPMADHNEYRPPTHWKKMQCNVE